MKTLKYASMLIILALLLTLLVVRCTLVYIPMGMVGVRTLEYGLIGPKGVEQADFGPGWHRGVWGLDSWQLFDSTVQTLEMTRDPDRGSRQGRDDVRVRSADGYAVSVDVTVKYRIKHGQAHKLYQDAGSGDKYKVIVRNEAQRTCMVLFGEMKTEDFYNSYKRRDICKKALANLRKALDAHYVDVVDLLIRNVQFDPDYEREIQKKKLADQEAELNKSLTIATDMRGKTQVIEAETMRLTSVIRKQKEAELITMQAQTDREIARIKADAEKYATEKRADADLIQAQKQAAGQLLVKKAEAEGERLRNQALAGSGGAVMAALEAARNLRIDKVEVSTLQLDLLDLDRMATRLGAPAEK